MYVTHVELMSHKLVTAERRGIGTTSLLTNVRKLCLVAVWVLQTRTITRKKKTADAPVIFAALGIEMRYRVKHANPHLIGMFLHKVNVVSVVAEAFRQSRIATKSVNNTAGRASK